MTGLKRAASTLLATALLVCALPATPLQAAAKPAKPKISAVSAVSSTTAKLTWKKSKKAAGYQVRQADKAKGKYKAIGTTKKTAFTAKKLKAGKTYYFKLRAYRKEGGKTVYSGYSAVKKLTMPKKGETPTKPGDPAKPGDPSNPGNPSVPAPAAPGGFTASAGAGGISLNWGAVAGASGYEVHRAPKSSGVFSVIATPAGTSLQDTGAVAGTEYLYKVRSYVTSGGQKVYSGFCAQTSAGILKVTGISFVRMDYDYQGGPILKGMVMRYTIHTSGGTGTLTLSEGTGSTIQYYSGYNKTTNSTINIHTPGQSYTHARYVSIPSTSGPQYSNYAFYDISCGGVSSPRKVFEGNYSTIP